MMKCAFAVFCYGNEKPKFFIYTRFNLPTLKKINEIVYSGALLACTGAVFIANNLILLIVPVIC